MKKQFKQTYLSPETETLLVQTEGSLCNNPSANAFIQEIVYGTDTQNDNGDF